MKSIHVIIAVIFILIAAVFGLFSKKETGVKAPLSSGSSTTTPPVITPSVTQYGTVHASIGQVIVFPDFSLRVTKVESDSRCPANANCVWAGTVVLGTEFINTKGTTTKQIELNKKKVVDSYEILLTDVTPAKLLNKEIAQMEYQFTIDVRKSAASSQPVAKTCYVGGCSSQICSDNPDAVSTCEYNETYACYKDAICERQASGKCGWTQTESFKMCIANIITDY